MTDPQVPEVCGTGARCACAPPRDPRPFNFAALNNAAAAASEADYLLFLNNDTEVVTPTWIEDLLEEAQRPDVGAVAPLLLFPDGTVQHAGAVLGHARLRRTSLRRFAPDETIPFGARPTARATGSPLPPPACFSSDASSSRWAVSTSRFVVAGNDVDLCLRLTERRLRSLFVPHVPLEHDESRSRGAHIDPGDFGARRELRRVQDRRRSVLQPESPPETDRLRAARAFRLRAADGGLQGPCSGSDRLHESRMRADPRVWSGLDGPSAKVGFDVVLRTFYSPVPRLDRVPSRCFRSGLGSCQACLGPRRPDATS